MLKAEAHQLCRWYKTTSLRIWERLHQALNPNALEKVMFGQVQILAILLSTAHRHFYKTQETTIPASQQ